MSDIRQPIVSVIIPFLNGGEWLAQAIESVIGQSYHNWEIILVDDGSAAEASGIAKDFAEKFPGKIIYVEHPGHVNKGVAASRNLGFRSSHGDMIAFLDSDDCWLPEKLSRQLAIFDSFPDVSVVCEASLYWRTWEQTSKEDVVVKVGVESEKVYTPPSLMFSLYPIGPGAAPCPSGLMLTRAAMERSGGFEESFTGQNQVYEDQAFLCKLYLRESVFVSGCFNNLYRQRSGSLMQSIEQHNRYLNVRKYFLHWLRRYLKTHGTNSMRLNLLVSKAFFDVNHPFLHKVRVKLTKRLFGSSRR